MDQDVESSFLLKVRDAYIENNASKIEKAYFFAKSAHRGQKRQSGEDYIIHPLSVAEILVDLGMDADTVIAALLHDVIEDTEVTADNVVEEFGNEVFLLVQGVTKLSKFNFKSREEAQAENLRRMFLAMSNDIRVIIIKLADRLNNMRTLAFKDADSQKRIAQETLEIYAPIASRLGIAPIKGELEDLCLRYLYPEDYFYIAEKVAQSKSERQKFVDSITVEIKALLKEIGIAGDVNGRPKHFYSIYRKLKKGKSFEEIYDLIALRIIVDSVKDCYAVLGAIHNKWKPLPGRFKDYISVPKANMYQSLHTTVIAPPYGSPFEIQIRTHEMHQIAEYGIAAHWKYKQGNTNSTQSIDDQKLAWIRGVMELQNEGMNSKEYLDNVKIDLYSDQVFVFTPRGDVFNLPNGSTGIDFAYLVHTQVGHHCVGIKINNKMVPISTKLGNGDVVEVITSNTSKGPSRDWLNIAITPAAKSKIKAFFKKVNREENVKIGRDTFEKVVRQKGYDFNELVKIPAWNDYIKNNYKAASIDDICASIGCGELSAYSLANKLIEIKNEEVNKGNVSIEQVMAKIPAKSSNGDSGILINGMGGMKVKFSQCCTALPGDEIVGYISRTRGVIIHRKNCPNVASLEPERIVSAEWPEVVTGKYEVFVEIVADERAGFVADIAMLIANMKVPMVTLDAKKIDNTTAIAKLSVEVSSTGEIKSLMQKLEQIKGVREVKRANGK